MVLLHRPPRPTGQNRGLPERLSPLAATGHGKADASGLEDGRPSKPLFSLAVRFCQRMRTPKRIVN